MPKIKSNQRLGSNHWWLRERELGIKYRLGHVDSFYKTLYSSIKVVGTWDEAQIRCQTMHGGVFNLEYSPDGSLLVAACEKKNVLMFDPLNRRLIHSIDNAHSGCVNCVKFLDQRMFATCSDDSTVALWDARNLKQRIRTLQGHSNWVKNIEYSPSDGLLLSSGFDGSIYAWDINSFTEHSFLYDRVFHINGLMRTTLTPDASKMLICTTSGYLIVIHNLRLRTLTQDLQGFKPNMYRLMQLSQTTIPVAANFTHLFSSKRAHNRVEFLTDFPMGDDAGVISSLQVHPQGWCVLSRNVSDDKKSEWTCVHDIQECQVPADILEDESASPVQKNRQQQLPTSESDQIAYSFLPDTVEEPRIVPATGLRANSFDTDDVDSRPNRTNWENIRRVRTYPQNLQLVSNSSNANYENGEEHGENRNIINNDDFSTANVELHVSTADVWEALVEIREVRGRREQERDIHRTIVNARNWFLRSRNELRAGGDDAADGNGGTPGNSHTVVILGDRGNATNQDQSGQKPLFAIPRNHKIHQNVSRLTHYIEEPNVGSGYIKELCFSADGRLICSPFGFGVRLLAFSDDCQDLSDCVPPADKSIKLHEIATNGSHTDFVLSTKFSPRHCLLVSGCLGGKIVWHQPLL